MSDSHLEQLRGRRVVTCEEPTGDWPTLSTPMIKKLTGMDAPEPEIEPLAEPDSQESLVSSHSSESHMSPTAIMSKRHNEKRDDREEELLDRAEKAEKELELLKNALGPLSARWDGQRTGEQGYIKELKAKEIMFEGTESLIFGITEWGGVKYISSDWNFSDDTGINIYKTEGEIAGEGWHLGTYVGQYFGNGCMKWVSQEALGRHWEEFSEDLDVHQRPIIYPTYNEVMDETDFVTWWYIPLEPFNGDPELSNEEHFIAGNYQEIRVPDALTDTIEVARYIRITIDFDWDERWMCDSLTKVDPAIIYASPYLLDLKKCLPEDMLTMLDSIGLSQDRPITAADSQEFLKLKLKEMKDMLTSDQLHSIGMRSDPEPGHQNPPFNIDMLPFNMSLQFNTLEEFEPTQIAEPIQQVFAVAVTDLGPEPEPEAD